MLLIALGVMVAAPWLAWRWAQHPFPAALFGPSYVTSAASPPNWEGARLGVWPPAQLEAVDGVRLDTPFALEREMSHRRIGDRVALTLKRPDGTREQVTVTLMQIGAADLILYMGLLYLVGLAYVAIGAWVYRKRYTRPDGRAFGALCAAVAIVTSAIFENSTTHVLSWLWFAALRRAHRVRPHGEPGHDLSPAAWPGQTLAAAHLVAEPLWPGRGARRTARHLQPERTLEL
jgi:hypothetical protein